MQHTCIPSDVKQLLGPNKVFIFSKSYCPYCDRAKSLLNKLKVPFDYVECDEIPLDSTQKSQLFSLSGISTFPNIFIGNKSIGGCDNLMKLEKSGELKTLLKSIGINI